MCFRTCVLVCVCVSVHVFVHVCVLFNGVLSMHHQCVSAMCSCVCASVCACVHLCVHLGVGCCLCPSCCGHQLNMFLFKKGLVKAPDLAIPRKPCIKPLVVNLASNSHSHLLPPIVTPSPYFVLLIHMCLSEKLFS